LVPTGVAKMTNIGKKPSLLNKCGLFETLLQNMADKIEESLAIRRFKSGARGSCL
jgi:hypothetical protein